MDTKSALFYVFSAVMLFAALRVITARNPVHAALYLVLAFLQASGIWMLLKAEFLSITLVLVYVGAVMVLFLFGTMLTRARIGAESDLNNSYKKLGIPVGLVMLVAMGLALTRSFGDEKLPESAKVVSTQEVSDQIFGPYLLPFWALSFVLLAAVVGAIVLARKD